MTEVYRDIFDRLVTGGLDGDYAIDYIQGDVSVNGSYALAAPGGGIDIKPPPYSPVVNGTMQLDFWVPAGTLDAFSPYYYLDWGLIDSPDLGAGWWRTAWIEAYPNGDGTWHVASSFDAVLDFTPDTDAWYTAKMTIDGSPTDEVKLKVWKQDDSEPTPFDSTGTCGSGNAPDWSTWLFFYAGAAVESRLDNIRFFDEILPVSPPLVPPSAVAILYDGVDIYADVLIEGCRFRSAANGSVGVCVIRVKDTAHTHQFTEGKELQLKFLGINQWTGYVSSVRRGYFFNSLPNEPDNVTRYFEIMGVDLNILYQRRILYDKVDPTNMELTNYPAGTHDDVILQAYMTDHLDLSGDGIGTSLIEHVGTPTVSDSPFSGAAGWRWGELLRMLTVNTGAIYYLDPDRQQVLTDVDTPNAPFGISDNPGAGQVGCRELDIDFNGAALRNDAMVWGAGQGSSKVVFKRTIDPDSVNDHNLWQVGQFLQTVWRQATVDRIADSQVYGSPANKRGGKDDAVAVRCTVFMPGFRVAQKVEFVSEVWGYSDTIPIRAIDISFPTKSAPKFVLELSHEIDTPWSTIEFWFPGFPPFPPLHPFPPITGPPFPPPPGPPGWPPFPPLPCFCCDQTTCAVRDTFTREDYPEWLDADTGETWVGAGSRIGGTDGERGVLHNEPGFSVGAVTNGTYYTAQQTLGDFDLPVELPIDATFDLSYTGVWTSEFSGNPEFSDGSLYHTPGFADSGTPTVQDWNGGAWQRAYLQISAESGLPNHKIWLYNAEGSLWLASWVYNTVAPWNDGPPTLVGAQLEPEEILHVRFHLDSDQARIKVWKDDSTEPGFWQYQTASSGSTYENFFQLLSRVGARSATQEVFQLFVDNLCIRGTNPGTSASRFDDFERTGADWGSPPTADPWVVEAAPASPYFAETDGSKGILRWIGDVFGPSGTLTATIDADGPWKDYPMSLMTRITIINAAGGKLGSWAITAGKAAVSWSTAAGGQLVVHANGYNTSFAFPDIFSEGVPIVVRLAYSSLTDIAKATIGLDEFVSANPGGYSTSDNYMQVSITGAGDGVGGDNGIGIEVDYLTFLSGGSDGTDPCTDAEPRDTPPRTGLFCELPARYGRNFGTKTQFVPGSLRVYIDGLLLRPSLVTAYPITAYFTVDAGVDLDSGQVVQACYEANSVLTPTAPDPL